MERRTRIEFDVAEALMATWVCTAVTLVILAGTAGFASWYQWPLFATALAITAVVVFFSVVMLWRMCKCIEFVTEDQS